METCERINPTKRLGTQKRNRKKSNTISIVNYQATKKDKRGKKWQEYSKDWKKINDLTRVSPSLPITSLNVNRLIKWLNRFLKIDPTICCLEETHFTSRQAESEKMKKDISSKWKFK
jgi:hypothetical protein